MLKGEQILNEVRDWIDDPGYSRFVEINQAYKKILRKTPFSFMRKTTEDLVSFTANVSTYSINMDDMDRLVALYIKGGTDLQFDLIEEVTPQLFEGEVNTNRDKVGNDTTGRPKFFKIEGGPNPTIHVTPIPNDAYTIRVDYKQKPTEITKASIVNFPSGYSDMLSKLAAGYILRRSKDGDSKSDGERYVNEALSEMDMLVRDVHPNRTYDIDRTAQTWIK